MEQQSGRRRRPALSCVQCRRRKIKCDRSNPCAQCTSTKTQCSYKVYSDGPSLRQQLEQSNPLDSSSNAIAFASASAATQQTSAARPATEHGGDSSEFRSTTVPATGRNDIPTSDRDRNLDTDLRDLLRRVRKLEQDSRSNSVHGPNEADQATLICQSSSLYDTQSSLNKTRILRWSHWADTAPEFANIFACFTVVSDYARDASLGCAESGTLFVQIGDLLRKCKEVARSLKANRPSRSLSRFAFDLELPPREVADMMVEIYLQSFESAHRILHIPTFWTEYRRFWEHPRNVTTDVRLQILLVIGIGSSLTDYGDTNTGFRTRVQQWIYAAQSWLAGPLEKDRLELGGIQIHCLTIVARQIFSIGGDLIWMSMGSLINSAMQIGLHRSASKLPTMSVMQAELRKRLWATILEMNLQSSLDSSMPPRLSLDEFDNEPPSNINDNELDQSTTDLQVYPREVYTASSMQLILLDSFPIRLRILQLLNGLRSEISYTDVLSLSSNIIDACRACSRFLEKSSTFGVTSFHRDLLDYLIRRFLILLHCPFASKARENPLFHYSLKVSLDAALAIVSPEQDKHFSRLMTVGGGLFKEGFRSASTVVSLEILAQVESQSLDGKLHCRFGHLNLLKEALKYMIALSTERIQRGETNVKSHLFLSMTLAEVEATESGDSIEIKIAQSARDSLDFSHGLLQARAIADPSPSTDDDMPMSFAGAQEDYDYDYDLESFLLNDGFP